MTGKARFARAGLFLRVAFASRVDNNSPGRFPLSFCFFRNQRVGADSGEMLSSNAVVVGMQRNTKTSVWFMKFGPSFAQCLGKGKGCILLRKHSYWT